MQNKVEVFCLCKISKQARAPPVPKTASKSALPQSHSLLYELPSAPVCTAFGVVRGKTAAFELRRGKSLVFKSGS
jgi:hypothetical protein